MITMSGSSGPFKLEAFLKRITDQNGLFSSFDKWGQRGVDALRSATPVDGGESSRAWYYEVVHAKGTHSIVWRNDEMGGDVPVVILVQYGHGTRNGGYVHGYDFINPALRPIFDQIADEIWAEVKK